MMGYGNDSRKNGPSGAWPARAICMKEKVDPASIHGVEHSIIQ